MRCFDLLLFDYCCRTCFCWDSGFGVVVALCLLWFGLISGWYVGWLRFWVNADFGCGGFDVVGVFVLLRFGALVWWLFIVVWYFWVACCVGFGFDFGCA